MRHGQNPKDVAIGVDVSIGVGTPGVSGQDAVVQVLLVVQGYVRLPEVSRGNPGTALLDCLPSFT